LPRIGVTELPTISVVTAAFNAEKHVESTIASVVGQRYPKLDYVFVDGASTDSTLEIALRYRASISTLISEKDAGQYDAIQKGLLATRGEVQAWLNADDIYLPWTFAVVGELFARFPELKWIIGAPSYLNARGQCTRVSGTAGAAYPQRYIRNGWYEARHAGYLQQESMFWRRSLWDRVGGLDLRYRYAADFDLWRRFAAETELVGVRVPLAAFRLLPGAQRSSVGRADYEAEVMEICRSLPRPPILWTRVAKLGPVFNHFMRVAIWKRAYTLQYVQDSQQWVRRKGFAPISRSTLRELIADHASS
jgi:hypothetical protein